MAQRGRLRHASVRVRPSVAGRSGIGLVLLVRGFGAAIASGRARIADTSTSAIASLAAGEVRVSGVIEPAELTLVSLLQSGRASTTARAWRRRRAVDADSAAVGASSRSAPWASACATRPGDIRVFPRGARIEAPVRWEDSTGDARRRAARPGAGGPRSPFGDGRHRPRPGGRRAAAPSMTRPGPGPTARGRRRPGDRGRADLSRGPPRARRRGHDRRPRPPLLRPGRPGGRRPGRRPGPGASGRRSGGRGRPRRGARAAGTLLARSGRRPGATRRSPASASAARSGQR